VVCLCMTSKLYNILVLDQIIHNYVSSCRSISSHDTVFVMTAICNVFSSSVIYLITAKNGDTLGQGKVPCNAWHCLYIFHDVQR